MINYAQKNPKPKRHASPAAQDEHIAPSPRISVQAFCETVETASAVQSAGEDRRLGKAHLKIQMGGMAAAIEAYRNAPTPNVVILETRRTRRHPGRPRSPCLGLRRRNAGRRHRPDERRPALSRAGATRRQRLCDRAGDPDRRRPRDLQPVLDAGSEAGRPHHRDHRRQGRRRRLDHRPQHRLGDRARSRARFRRRRPRSCLRHRRPRLQSGSDARDRRCGVLAGSHRHRLRRPAAVEVHRSSEPARRAGDARSRLRFRRRGVRLGFRHVALDACRASCWIFRINGPAGPSER